MAKRCLMALALGALVFSTGCMCQLSGMAPSTTPITADDSYTRIGKTSGKAWGAMFYVIPWFENDPSRLAIERAIARGGGNAMTEVCQDVNMLFLYIVTLYWTNVEGTAVKVERGGAKAAQADGASGRPQQVSVVPPLKIPPIRR